MSIVDALMSTRDGDRRAAIRVAIAARCVLRAGRSGVGDARRIRVRDASLGGAFITGLSSRLPLRSVVHLELDRAGDSRRSARAYSVPATVVRLEAGGVALQFDRLRPSAMSRLLLLSKDQREYRTMKRTDEQIAADVLQSLRDEPRVARAEVSVQVAAGVVTLTGFVGSWGVKMAAQDAARRVPGTVDVRNAIEFQMGDSARLTDADVARAVRQALERDLPGLERLVGCTVLAGWVSLEGAVDHWKQRSDVERVVRKLPGVLGVASKLDLRSSLPRQDDGPYAGTGA